MGAYIIVPYLCMVQSATPCGTSDTSGTRGPILWVYPAKCHYRNSKSLVTANELWRSHSLQVLSTDAFHSEHALYSTVIIGH